MGLYDRDYGRDDNLMPWEQYERSQQKMQPKGILIALIVVTAAIFFVDMLTVEKVTVGGKVFRISRFSQWFATRPDTLIQPWTWFQFLTYGFLHSTSNIFHIIFNMFLLFVFGRPVEQQIGRGEFLRFYLVSMFVGGVVGAITCWITGATGVIGASGAVLAVTVLFACYFPNQTVLFLFVFPMKAWVMAAIFVAADLIGTLLAFQEVVEGVQRTAESHGRTAFTVHLAGAAFGFLYFRQKWNLAWLDLTRLKDRMSRSARRTRLKIHDPDKKMAQEEEEADRILAKIHESGEQSLTAAERRTLKRYSKRKRENREL